MTCSSHKSDSNDKWGLWANRLVRKKNASAEIIWTFYVSIKCLYWKIKLGREIKFYGNMHFQRYPSSTIIISDKCRFRSAAWSNLIGINRACSLCTLRKDAEIVIGRKSGFSSTAICAAERIEIGANVICGANTTITDTDWHHLNRSLDGIELANSAPVRIGSNVWIGLNATVLKGVTIGSNSVIAANSLVINDIPPNVIAAGQPAKTINFL